jgi:hypothetical protein
MEKMKINTLIEVISAAHLSHYINSPFPERSGIMFVGPPANLKTAVIEIMDNYPNAIVLSDLTVKQGVGLREDISANKIITLAFADFAKLYQRGTAGAMNIEGYVRALPAEGFRKANWEDSRMVCTPARALILGCMTNRFYTLHYSQWLDDGFARRFLWSHFHLADPELILNAIVEGERIDFSDKTGFNPKIPTSKGAIPWSTNATEGHELRMLLKNQPGPELGLILLKKMIAALRWKFPREKNKPMDIIHDFAKSLTREGVELTL